MFKLRDPLLDISEGFYGGSTSDRTFDRQNLYLKSKQKCIERMSISADMNREFKFKVIIGLKSKMSASLASRISALSGGEYYFDSKATVAKIFAKTKRNMAGRPIAKRFKIHLKGSWTQIKSALSSYHPEVLPAFSKRCPSFEERDKSRTSFLLNITLMNNEYDEVCKNLATVLENTDRVHELSVTYIEPFIATSVILDLFGKKQLKIRFVGVRKDIKAIVNALDINDNSVQRFTHEFCK